MGPALGQIRESRLFAHVDVAVVEEDGELISGNGESFVLYNELSESSVSTEEICNIIDLIGLHSELLPTFVSYFGKWPQCFGTNCNFSVLPLLQSVTPVDLCLGKGSNLDIVVQEDIRG